MAFYVEIIKNLIPQNIQKATMNLDQLSKETKFLCVNFDCKPSAFEYLWQQQQR